MNDIKGPEIGNSCPAQMPSGMWTSQSSMRTQVRLLIVTSWNGAVI